MKDVRKVDFVVDFGYFFKIGCCGFFRVKDDVLRFLLVWEDLGLIEWEEFYYFF